MAPVGGVPRGEAVVRANRKRGRQTDRAESLQVTSTQSLQGHMGYSTYPELYFRESTNSECWLSQSYGVLLVSSRCLAWWCSAGALQISLANMHRHDGNRLHKGAAAGDTSKAGWDES